MKLRADIIAVYREVHSWVGVVAGLFLFIAFYAGAISMFEPTLEAWLTPPPVLPAAVSLEQTPELLNKAFAVYPEARRQYSVVISPDADHPARLQWPLGEGRHGHGSSAMMMAALDTQGGLVTATHKPSPVARLIDTVHQRMGLPLPHEPAMIVMGFIALGYALALVSGTIIFIPAMARALFAVRLVGSVRRKWLDLHNLLGFCSLPFHIVMALTSVIFAFHEVIFAVQGEFLSHAGNSGEHERHGGGKGRGHGPAMGGIPAEARPAQGAALLAPAEVLARLAQVAPGFVPDTLDYSMRPNASRGASPGSGPVLRVSGHDPAHVMRGPTSGFATLDPYTGRILWSDYLPGHQSAGFAALTSFFALHFGSYGGVPIRWIYLALGFAGAFLFYTGNKLWIAVRRRKEKATGCLTDTRSTCFLSRLTTGCCTGCMTAIAILLCVALQFPGLLSEAWAFRIYHGVFWLMLLGALPFAAGEALMLWLAAFAHATLAVLVLLRGGQTYAANWSVALLALGLTFLLLRLARQQGGVVRPA
ncbi:PepSY-associated TM helix domain-containing protein [Asaia lannensis]|uniref:PepSY domain-containing protein n=1 Tax=Asaia lannensis NBRC 102526 TaxID=1307926 RepID=A0ABT1CJ46_9PROT|nr:PepSY-associated TM helix domain-containing protein [Asaia lannensis]MCO6160885.1 PepSY domain-containing protein [Asaia lannensis NBRC 102526]GBR01518.1 hypothetical protein AA102526_2534 [Asaia lannensis NBRC 102526]